MMRRVVMALLSVNVQLLTLILTVLAQLGMRPPSSYLDARRAALERIREHVVDAPL